MSEGKKGRFLAEEPCEMPPGIPEGTAMIIRHVQDTPTDCHLDLWINHDLGGHDSDHIIHNVVMMLLERPHTNWSLAALVRVGQSLRARMEALEPKGRPS